MTCVAMVSEETPGDGEPAPDDEVQQEAMDIEAVKVGTVALSFWTCYVAMDIEAVKVGTVALSFSTCYVAMDIEAVKVGTVALSFWTCYVADSCRNKCGGQRRKGCVLAGLIAKYYWGEN